VKTVLFSLIVATSLSSLAPQNPAKPDPSSAPKEAVIVKAASVKWVDHPSVPGAKMAVQSGDPAKGPAVVLMKFPKGTTVPAHWHTSGETVTLVSGTAVFGTTDTVDAAKGTELGAGSYVVIPGSNPHWSIAKEEFVISVSTEKAADFHLCGEKSEKK
jgi:quercetin dioxygenase-like cupin family protein